MWHCCTRCIVSPFQFQYREAEETRKKLEAAQAREAATLAAQREAEARLASAAEAEKSVREQAAAAQHIQEQATKDLQQAKQACLLSAALYLIDRLGCSPPCPGKLQHLHGSACTCAPWQQRA